MDNVLFSLCRKKLSKFSQRPDWYNASNNVAKRYMKEVPKDTYFEDVKLQMDSKLWGELYNKIDVVPKKVLITMNPMFGYVCIELSMRSLKQA